jgi:competence protein ComEC
MIYWREIPFVKISIALIIGILLKEWGANWNVLIIGSLVGICICLLCLKGDEIRIKAVSSFLLLSCISFTGFMLLTLSDSRLNKRHFERIAASGSPFEGSGYIEYAGTTGSGKQKLEVNLLSCRNQQNMLVPCNGKVILYVSEEMTLQNTAYGDEILFKGNLRQIESTKNPYSFDFQKYMERKGITHQVYIHENSLKSTGYRKGNLILQMAYDARLACLEIISARVDSPAERGVASALLLGYREWIPDDVNTEYALTGATHVLSVSGLHTGIIAGMLLWVFGRIQNNSLPFRIGKCFSAIAALWAFAIISGLCPSVMRAAIMFSFVLVARLLLKKKVNIINVIALSAFILLIYNPHILFDIGFQLSYSALLGIIYFQSWVYRSVYVPSAGLKVWNLISVSIAAQLGTLPFTLFYFNQFPVYFWLSGLFVVPLAGVIMLLGIATIAMNFMPDFIANIPGYLLSFSTWLMNQSVAWTAHLPGAKTEGISLSFIQALVLMLSILFLARAIQPWKSLHLKGSLACLAIFFAIYIADDIQKSQQNKMVVYHVKKGILIDFYDGSNCICITDLDTLSSSYSMAVSKNRIMHKVKVCNIVHPDDEWVSKLASYKNRILEFNSNNQSYSLNGFPANKELMDYKIPNDMAFEINLKNKDGRILLSKNESDNYLAEK